MKRPLWLFALGALGVLTLLVAANRPAAAAVTAGALDGKLFLVTTGENGKPTGEKDELVFKGGTFRSTACDTYGFGSAPYAAFRAPDGSTNFRVTTASPKEGTIRWQGRVQGDAISGSYVWEKAGQKPISYWLKGSLKR